MAIQNGLGGGQIFFKIKNVSISCDVLLHFMNIKMYFDACRQRLHNSGLICNYLHNLRYSVHGS